MKAVQQEISRKVTCTPKNMKGPTTGVAPPDYKFHVANGEIFVRIIYNRGYPSECSAEFDEQFHRVDEYGCFS
jgi:hypothetical protein